MIRVPLFYYLVFIKEPRNKKGQKGTTQEPRRGKMGGVGEKKKP